MVKRIRRAVVTLLGLVFALIASEAKGDEFYYAMIFGSQSKPKLLQYTHTWATFIRAVGQGSDANNYSVYPHTISWLPQSFDVQTWSLITELVRIGKPASRYIARQEMTRSVFDQWESDNCWLIPRLGLDRYPIELVLPEQIPKRNCFLCRCPD